MTHVTINAIGDLGDGIANIGQDPVFVRRTITGEVVDIDTQRPHANLLEIVKPSDERVDPLCRHFSTCGNCAVQHFSERKALEWKQEKVIDAFRAAGLKTEVLPCTGAPIHSRRRVTFTAIRKGSSVVLGYKERGSDTLVAINECPILLPAIEDHLSLFAGLAATLIRGGEEIQMAVTACINGLDMDILLDQAPTEDMIAGFVRAYSRSILLRASVNGEVIAEKEKPVLHFGKAEVAMPPGAFTQAVEEAERTMADLVLNHLKRRKRVVDLFAGSGTFALRLATWANVHAVEVDAAALAAVSTASGADGLRPVTTEQRDLFELPLMASELKRFDGLCLDPPRAGADAQAIEIARSNIPSVAYVSCNPKTLARDAAILVEGGYVIDTVMPVDQFVFSHHVEVVALFSKKATKKNRSIFR